MQLKSQQDVNSLHIGELQTKVRELQDSLSQKKEIYKALKREIKSLDDQSESLKFDLTECAEEIDLTRELLQQKKLTIEQLSKVTGEQPPEVEVYTPRKQEVYRAVKGDLTDELLARYINESGTQLPIARISEGWYLFGTRKIYAKVNNGRLVVRVGGGYSALIEFIGQYSQQEMEKISDLISKNDWDF